MTREEAGRCAERAGFSHWGFFETPALEFLPAVRDMCAADRCRQYGRSWSCPPGCGSLDECRERAMGFAWGILLQTTAQLEDDFDVETMMDAEALQRERFGAYRAMAGEECLALGAGACTICERCTYPDAPCRFPARMTPSMEAFGLQVSDVCRSAGIPYYYGPRTITYSCCVLFL